MQAIATVVRVGLLQVAGHEDEVGRIFEGDPVEVTQIPAQMAGALVGGVGSVEVLPLRQDAQRLPAFPYGETEARLLGHVLAVGRPVEGHAFFLIIDQVFRVLAEEHQVEVVGRDGHPRRDQESRDPPAQIGTRRC